MSVYRTIGPTLVKKNGLYVFFDSHSHGENGLSSSDGASSLITFSNLNDLVTYLYAFYDSIKLDTYLQFDFMPMNVKKCEDKQSYKDEMASHMEAYFIDQRLKQAMKTQSNVRSIPYDLSRVTIKDSKKSSGAKRKKLRIEYYKKYRRQSRQNPAFKANEIVYQRESRQSARKNPAFKTKERESKQSERRNPVLGLKKLFIRGNQSNQKGETLFLGQNKLFIRGNQSNQKGETLFLGQKKLLIRGNQSNQKGETLFLGQKKENQSN